MLSRLARVEKIQPRQLRSRPGPARLSSTSSDNACGDSGSFLNLSVI
jgi:hypothetical protein